MRRDYRQARRNAASKHCFQTANSILFNRYSNSARISFFSMESGTNSGRAASILKSTRTWTRKIEPQPEAIELHAGKIHEGAGASVAALSRHMRFIVGQIEGLHVLIVKRSSIVVNPVRVCWRYCIAPVNLPFIQLTAPQQAVRTCFRADFLDTSIRKLVAASATL